MIPFLGRIYLEFVFSFAKRFSKILVLILKMSSFYSWIWMMNWIWIMHWLLRAKSSFLRSLRLFLASTFVYENSDLSQIMLFWRIEVAGNPFYTSLYKMWGRIFGYLIQQCRHTFSILVIGSWYALVTVLMALNWKLLSLFRKKVTFILWKAYISFVLGCWLHYLIFPSTCLPFLEFLKFLLNSCILTMN